MGDDYGDDDLVIHSSINIPGWSDNELRVMSRTYKFVMNKWNPKTAKTILTRFFNFYFTGRIPSEDNLIATVHDCVSLAHVDGHRLFNPRPSGKIYYQDNVSTPTSVTSEINGISEGPAVTRKLSAFHSYIKKAIDDFHTKSSTCTSDRELQALAGFLALTLCRFATRNLKQMMIAFNDAQYRNILESAAGWSKDKPFAPPIKEVLSSCCTQLTKSSPETRILFCILADEMVRTHALDNPKPKNRGYLDASVLSDTAYNGLGMIKMLIDVCELLEISWEAIRPLLSNDHAEKSCRRIDDFFTNYLKKGEHGFAWARIIDDGYLRGYSPKENEFVCIAFTAIIEYDKGPAVWQAPWIKSNVSFYFAAKQRGKTIYENKTIRRKAKLVKSVKVPDKTPGPPVQNELELNMKKPLDDRELDGVDLFEYYNGLAAEVVPISDFIKKATQLSEGNKDWTNFWHSHGEMLNKWSSDGHHDVVRHLFKTLKHGLPVAVECVKMGKLSIMSAKASQYDMMMKELKRLTDHLHIMNETLRAESEAREAKNLDLIQRSKATLSALATLERSVKNIILQKES
ncbi:uncharacterized protein [Chelonus insularis]|uniref:uncharacterized protein n=1 Tax=Chelonus insularis TaxID=460826 RepID=UPI00158EB153|nr:uncharacterized protein LOC118071512 [Chelonus insularis]